MKNYKIAPFMFALILLVLSVLISSKNENRIGQASITIPATYDEVQVDDDELRGMWVSYITLDMQSTDMSEKAFKKKADAIIKESKDAGFNTLIVQVRPFCDALYRSSYFPWSHILSGVQGQDPGYDPLEYFCTQCHKNGLSIHAWVNPYRVKLKETPKALCETNPYSNNSEIGFEYDGCAYLNPASSDAQELIVRGTQEIAKKYDVDGIQFDDYFYPSGCDDFDDDLYNSYTIIDDGELSKADWRKENVSKLIKRVYKAIHEVSDDTVFGISPQGNIRNNAALGADVYKWCEEAGYIDYIAPQIYFSLDNPALTFEKGLDEWLDIKKHKKLSVYVGLAGYKGGTDADSGTWEDNSDILMSEIKIIREKKLPGFMLYSYESLHNKENSAEIKNVISYLVSSPKQ